ncbi:ribonuclease P protein component [Sporobacter termitidis DSM 10068]|uniref:Ribonuclease P protein component n=1 Tax=Sporobacter termitidis DSM 10068 TaxID=1123282 RepID=A0A1M5YMH3_9FIRM|nr:ribonuclease P protein component [Sporobacter termitidis]SHI13181.1 ribonuclease P protein component [Sporobacter termitidis DSM 10068]
MRYSTSLKNNYEFRRLYTKGRSAASQYAVVYCRKNKGSMNKLGLTVSTKIGKAVQRNRIRRRFKEIYRLNEDKLIPGFDIVIVARTKSRFATYHALEADLLSLMGRLGLRAAEK